MEVTPWMMLVVSVAGFLIGLTKAGMGGLLGPAITALMVLVLPVDVALGILLPMLIVGDGFALAALWGRWDRRAAMLLGLGALGGVVAGSWILAATPAVVVRRLIGVVSLGFVVYRLAAPRLERLRLGPPGRTVGLIAGATAGVASTLAHAGGPPVAIYLLLRRLPPATYTSTVILLFSVVNLIKVPGYLLAGLIDPGLQLRLAPTLAAIPVGVLVGRWAVTRVSQALFDAVILVVLAVTGTYLLAA